MDGIRFETPQLPVARAPLAPSWMGSSTILKVVGVAALIVALIAAVYVYWTRRTATVGESARAPAAAPLPVAHPVVRAQPPAVASRAPARPPEPALAPAFVAGSPQTATATPMVVAAVPRAAGGAAPAAAQPRIARQQIQQKWQNAVQKIKSQGDLQTQLVKSSDHVIAFRMRVILAFLVGFTLTDAKNIEKIAASLKNFAEPIKYRHPDLLLRKLHAMYHNPNEQAKSQIDALMKAHKWFNPINFQAKQKLLEELYPVVCGTTTDDGRRREKVTIKNFAYGTMQEFEDSLNRFLEAPTVEQFEATPRAPAPAQ